MQVSNSHCCSGLILSPLNPAVMSPCSCLLLYSSYVSQSSPSLPTNVCSPGVLRGQGPPLLAPSTLGDCSGGSCCADNWKSIHTQGPVSDLRSTSSSAVNNWVQLLLVKLGSCLVFTFVYLCVSVCRHQVGNPHT